MKVLYSKKNGITNKLSGVNLPVDADKIDYDNTESELQSTNVQDAIDEINSGKVDKVTGKDLSTNDYDNTEKEQNTNNASAIEAIVNVYGGKNLLQISATSGTVDNVQYTVNSDGSISASGLANGSAVKTIAIFSLPIGIYKINGCGDTQHLYCTLRNNADDSYIANLTDDDYILTVNNSSFVYKIQMQTTSGINVDDTLYPMLRDARISDSTYVPYAKTNKELTDETNSIAPMLNFYGSKNLFPDFIESQTYKGITWTRNADTSITVNGTAEGWSTLAYSSSIKLKAGTYILSSGLAWPACYDTYAELNYNDGTAHIINTSYADEVTFTLANDTTIPTVQVVVRSNKTVSNITIKPMIRDARISDPTYAPYAMTNRELTLEAKKTIHITSSHLDQNDTYDFSLLSLGFTNVYQKQYLIVSNGNYPMATSGAWLVYIGDASAGIHITTLENRNLALALNDNTTKTFRITYGYESGDYEFITIKEL